MIPDAYSSFLKQAGWEQAEYQPLPADASARQYARLVLAGETRILAILPEISRKTLPEIKNAQEQKASLLNLRTLSTSERKEHSYVIKAHLSDNEMSAFFCLTTVLRERGFSAPEIFAVDQQKGLLLLEDFGKSSFSCLLKTEPLSKTGFQSNPKTHTVQKDRKEPLSLSPQNLKAATPSSGLPQKQALYRQAIATLGALYRCSFPARIEKDGFLWEIPPCDSLVLETELDLFLDEYCRYFLRKEPFSEKALQDWKSVWSQCFSALPMIPEGLALRDFHVDNLFWLSDREHNARIGLIDYQDAFFIHPAYDLVSLLEDARSDINREWVPKGIEYFLECAGLKAYRKAFLPAYTVFGAQRHFKVLGIFARLIRRDHKKTYLQYMPRVKNYIREALCFTCLAPVKTWLQTHLPDFLDLLEEQNRPEERKTCHHQKTGRRKN